MNYPDPSPTGSLARGLDRISGRVLDFGCWTGRAGRYLAGRGCKMYGVEQAPEPAAKASEAYERVWTVDLTEEGTWTILSESAPYDTILWLDILEHLPNPEDALRRSLRLLIPGGLALFSIPNIAHWTIRRNLLLGRWNYTETGILDRTHLRFYTRKTARRLIEDAGLKIVWEQPTNSRLPLLPAMPHFDLLVARLWPTMFGCQFVILAHI
jgi:2-polyprenyl-3-methyl-5-hydroxy-6-metoxy-1,4-benzoquinol methylase